MSLPTGRRPPRCLDLSKFPILTPDEQLLSEGYANEIRSNFNLLFRDIPDPDKPSIFMTDYLVFLLADARDLRAILPVLYHAWEPVLHHSIILFYNSCLESYERGLKSGLIEASTALELRLETLTTLTIDRAIIRLKKIRDAIELDHGFSEKCYEDRRILKFLITRLEKVLDDGKVTLGKIAQKGAMRISAAFDRQDAIEMQRASGSKAAAKRSRSP